MDIQSHALDRIRRFFSGGLDIIEYVGLLVIAFAPTTAMYHEITSMCHVRYPYREDTAAANQKPYVRE